MGEIADLTTLKEPDNRRQRRLLAAYLRAFESYDVAPIVDLLAADVVWEMPAFPRWYRVPSRRAP